MAFTPGNLARVMKKLNTEIFRFGGVTLRGIIRASLLILREARENVPVDTTNLKASGFVVWSGGGASQEAVSFNDAKGGAAKASKDHATGLADAKGIVGGKRSMPGAVVGFTASYSLFVHENLKAKHVVGGAKFLEKAISENEDKIVEMIVQEVKG